MLDRVLSEQFINRLFEFFSLFKIDEKEESFKKFENLEGEKKVLKKVEYELEEKSEISDKVRSKQFIDKVSEFFALFKIDEEKKEKREDEEKKESQSEGSCFILKGNGLRDDWFGFYMWIHHDNPSFIGTTSRSNSFSKF